MKTSRQLKITAILLVLTLLLAFFRVGFSQEGKIQIDANEKNIVVDSICTNLEREYIFPEITQKYTDKLKEYLQSGKYDSIKEPEEFAAKITEDLAAIYKDEHLHIWYNPEWIKNEKQRAELDEVAILQKKREERNVNYGFEEIKIFPGNIGYLKLNSFSYDTDAFNVAIAAMNFLSNTDALIIDLRKNGGGSPEMVQFLCSYFLDNPRKHLNSFYYKEKDKTTQYWTYTYLPGKRLDKVDLYLLTSKNTFSAAEGFSYHLKNMKRATVIGETTGGGAHNNKFIILNDNFEMSLPFARAINPITKTNWEGVGVEPDVKTTKANAKETAYLLALEKLSEKEQDEKIKYGIDWAIAGLKAKLNPIDLDKKIMESYVGTYGPRKITFENGVLYYQREDRPKMKMLPINDDTFMFEEIDYFRLKVIMENGKVTAVEGYYDTGRTNRNNKS